MAASQELGMDLEILQNPMGDGFLHQRKSGVNPEQIWILRGDNFYWNKFDFKACSNPHYTIRENRISQPKMKPNT